MSPITPEQRTLRARMAAHASWAATADPSARTAPARQASMARFEREVDPEGVLPVAERQRRAESAKKSFYSGLAYKSALARRKARDASRPRGIVPGADIMTATTAKSGGHVDDTA